MSKNQKSVFGKTLINSTNPSSNIGKSSINKNMKLVIKNR